MVKKEGKETFHFHVILLTGDLSAIPKFLFCELHCIWFYVDLGL